MCDGGDSIGRISRSFATESIQKDASHGARKFIALRSTANEKLNDGFHGSRTPATGYADLGQAYNLLQPVAIGYVIIDANDRRIFGNATLYG